MTERDLSAVYDFIHNEEITTFLTEYTDLFLSWEQFRSQPMPPSCSPELMWEVVEFVRLTGFSTEMPGGDTVKRAPSGAVWHCSSPSMSALLTQLAYRGSTLGVLSNQLSQYRNYFKRDALLLSDLVAASVRDGVDVDVSAVMQIAAGERIPVTPEEQLIANTVEILDDLDECTNRAFSREFFLALLERLDVGCEALVYKPARRPSSCYDVYGEKVDGPYGHCYSKAQKEQCLDYISQLDAFPYHIESAPIAAVVIASDLIFEVQPFERWNAFLEIILRRLSFMKLNKRALAFVPFSRYMLDWEREAPYLEELPFRFGHAILHSKFGNDVTPYIMQLLQFLAQGLDEIEQETSVLVERLARCHKLLEGDARLNYRQRDLLMQLLSDPSTAVDSSTYEREYDITLVTARADLKRLVQMGFLYMRESGKKQVFLPVPRMMEDILKREA